MILVTGATGTVGSEVIKRLSAHGIAVRAVTRDPRKIEAHRLPYVHLCRPRRCGRRWSSWDSRLGRRTVCSKSSPCTVVARLPKSIQA